MNGYLLLKSSDKTPIKDKRSTLMWKDNIKMNCTGFDESVKTQYSCSQYDPVAFNNKETL
jgi:hypothetical protein